MKADLVLHTRSVEADGALVEMKIWRVSISPATPAGFKYSLVYIKDGRRLLGYDNHERRGDHRHSRGRTTPYPFTTIGQVITDFLRDLRALKEELADESQAHHGGHPSA